MRAVLRLAWRDIRRAKGRSALIMAMIGLPVLVVSALLTGYATVLVSPREGVETSMGRADAIVRPSSVHGPVEQHPLSAMAFHLGLGNQPPEPWRPEEVAALLPPGHRALPYQVGTAEVRLPGGFETLDAVEVDLRDPLTDGMRTLVEGRLPAAAGEVAVTEAVLDLGVRLGDTVPVTRHARPATVVGVVEHPQRPTADEIVSLPGLLLLRPQKGEDLGFLVDTPAPVTWPEVQRLNRSGLGVLSRAVIMDPPDETSRSGYAPGYALGSALAVFMVVLEVVLLAGPAFTVGLRRRRDELATIAAQGASKRHLRMIVLADGLLLGGLGAIAGGLLGVVLALVGTPFVARLGTPLGPPEVPWAQVLAVVALGLVSGVCAAIAPAVQVGRESRSARRKAGKPVLGVVLIGLGLAATVLILQGDAIFGFGSWEWRALTDVLVVAASVVVVLGVIALMPWLVVRSGRAARRLPMVLRLPVRDASRHRVRTASAAAAVMAVTAAALAFAIGYQSNHRGNLANYRAGAPLGMMMVNGQHGVTTWERVRAEAEARLPGVGLVPGMVALDAEDRVITFSMPRTCSAGCKSYGWHGEELPMGDAALLRLFQGRDDPAAAAALSEGKAVIFDSGVIIDNGTITLNGYYRYDAIPDPVRVTLPAVRATAADPAQGGAVLPAAAVAAASGLKVAEARLYGMHVPADELRLERDLMAAGSADLFVEHGYPDPMAGQLWILFGSSLVVVLGGTLIATRLAAADWRQEQATMAAIGAGAGTHRGMLAGQAGFIALLGSVAGMFVGGVAGAALAISLTAKRSGSFELPETTTFVVPWGFTVAMVLGLPLLAALIAGVFTRRPRPALTRRAT
ncbi:ABC transporter permease [Nonomuraea soli]|uniref:Putative ABC transport system permease protein n=1 Tax=Nonomuraea soli TaxID=1032476 RepID=A0A7W0CMY4_9ACTN|nr:ABC transporter permease [Nonomuraea soli]MBA2894060.1 putative ABC transport system permease protein [Nonomuraea soli]